MALEVEGGKEGTEVKSWQKGLLQAAVWPPIPRIVEASGRPMLTVEHFRSRYELLGLLGKGSYGNTFAARCSYSSDVLVAVKVSFELETAREPWMLHFCKHPNVVELIDYFASPYCTMMALKRFDCTLQQYMTSSGIVESQALQINIGISRALAFVHEQGVIHLDLHTKNILLTTGTGDCLFACLADFGIAHFFHTSQQLPGFDVHPELHRAAELFFAKGATLLLPRSNVSHGGTDPKGGANPKYTLDYMQPRVVPKHCFAPALDMWAYGCVMYYMKYRKLLFDGPLNLYNEGVRPSPRAQLVLDIVCSLGPPDPALVRKHSWTIVGEVLAFSSTGRRTAITWTEDANVIRQCLAYDRSARMTALQLSEHCRCMMEAGTPPIRDGHV